MSSGRNWRQQIENDDLRHIREGIEDHLLIRHDLAAADAAVAEGLAGDGETEEIEAPPIMAAE